jgi:hypothetical protein
MFSCLKIHRICIYMDVKDKRNSVSSFYQYIIILCVWSIINNVLIECLWFHLIYYTVLKYDRSP